MEQSLEKIDYMDLIVELEKRGYSVKSFESLLKETETHLLIEEINSRGFTVDFENERLEEVIWQYQRGNKKEALYQLEKEFSELRGISD